MKVNQNKSANYWNTRCMKCNGTGKTAKGKCQKCHGTGIWCILCNGTEAKFSKKNCPNKRR